MSYTPPLGVAFGLSRTVENLQAVNVYITGLAAKVDNDWAAKRMTKARHDKWLEQFDDWRGFYKDLLNGLYVTEDDLKVAYFKRDQIDYNLMPEETERRRALSHEKSATIDPATQSPWWKWPLIAGGGFLMVYLLASVAIRAGVAKVAMPKLASRTANPRRKRKR